MISSDVIRGYSDILILFLLIGRDSYGYEISKDIRELTDEKYIMKETTPIPLSRVLKKAGTSLPIIRKDLRRSGAPIFILPTKAAAIMQKKCAEWRLVKEVVNQFIIEGK